MKHRSDFYDEKSMSENGAFAFGTGSVLCGVRTGASHRQFSMEQQRHICHLSSVYFGDCGAPLGTIWEKTEVII